VRSAPNFSLSHSLLAHAEQYKVCISLNSNHSQIEKQDHGVRTNKQLGARAVVDAFVIPVSERLDPEAVPVPANYWSHISVYVLTCPLAGSVA
jgi:hypothetical protein